MKICVLASGSKGNSTLIQTENTNTLIDLGMSNLYIEKQLIALGIDPDKIDNVFITHTHVDHVAGLKVFVKKHKPTVYLTQKMYDELKETSEGNYKFIMTATGQNHFPYDGKRYDYYDIDVIESEYDEESTNILKNYAQGVYDADKELNNLYQKIQKLDVPTIIVFFGDHLPYTVASDGNDSYTNSDYFNTENKQLNTLRKYTTKAVILSNYDIDMDDFDYLNSNYLGAYVLNKLDLEISSYFKFIDETRETVPVFDRNSILINNEVISIETMDEKYKKVLDNYKCVQHNKFYDYAIK